MRERRFQFVRVSPDFPDFDVELHSAQVFNQIRSWSPFGSRIRATLEETEGGYWGSIEVSLGTRLIREKVFAEKPILALDRLRIVMKDLLLQSGFHGPRKRVS